MRIAVLNFSQLGTADVRPAIQAVNLQLKRDFARWWGQAAQLQLKRPVGSRPSTQHPAVHADAVLYLVQESKSNAEGTVLGYHDKNHGELPFGFVYVSDDDEDSWTTTFSHEVIEMVADPWVNLLVRGPHPHHAHHQVFHWFELSDAVEEESYQVEGVSVSNFLLPGYFNLQARIGTPTDFLSAHRGHRPTLQPFSLRPGGYLGFYDPKYDRTTTVTEPEDATAARRLARARRRQHSRTARRLQETATQLPLASAPPLQ